MVTVGCVRWLVIVNLTLTLAMLQLGQVLIVTFISHKLYILSLLVRSGLLDGISLLGFLGMVCWVQFAGWDLLGLVFWVRFNGVALFRCRPRRQGTTLQLTP